MQSLPNTRNFSGEKANPRRFQSQDMDDSPNAEEVSELLDRFGFTDYEATCLVAVLRQPGATAAEIADASTLPRSRVYDVADDLADRGYLEVQEGDPKRYRALPADDLVATLRSRYDETIDELSEALADVERIDEEPDARAAVWSFTGEDAALARSWEIIEEAEDSIWMLVRSELLSEECIEVLSAAADRGVDLTLATDAEDFQVWLADEVPGASVTAVPDRLAYRQDETEIVRLQVCDDDAVMTVTACQSSPAQPRDYRGCLATGERCGFVQTHRQLLGLTAED
jgi:sugar-specific transcriptional regulator TrmB